MVLESDTSGKVVAEVAVDVVAVGVSEVLAVDVAESFGDPTVRSDSWGLFTTRNPCCRSNFITTSRQGLWGRILQSAL